MYIHVIQTGANTSMKTSTASLNKIAEFEGIRLKAYKCPAGVWTIGVGHTNGVTEGMTITQAQAMAFFESDIRKYEDYVTATGLTLNQNQFDALVSFSFNCGVGNLQKLVKGRDYQQIADAMLKYDKAKVKGVLTVLPGLTRRRKWERELFLSGGIPVKQEQPKSGNPYQEPKKNVRLGSKGNDVRWLQYELNKRWYKLVVDGVAGKLTISALIDYQKQNGLDPDGICGPKTIASLKRS